MNPNELKWTQMNYSNSSVSANSISANVGLLVRVLVPFTTYILPRLVRIRLVAMPFFRNALLALTEELLYNELKSTKLTQISTNLNIFDSTQMNPNEPKRTQMDPNELK